MMEVSGAVFVPDGSLLVLERKTFIAQEGSLEKIKYQITVNQVLASELQQKKFHNVIKTTLITINKNALNPNGLSENFEAIAARTYGNTTDIFLLSDDQALNGTALLQFSLISDLYVHDEI